MPQVLLLGYFGAGNFGDDALLVDWLARHAGWLRERQLGVHVVYNGQDPLAGFVEAEKLRPLIAQLVPKQSALKLDPRQYAAVIAPGGSLLQDATSLRSLLYYLWIVRRFAAAGTKVFLLNQGLGPFTSGVARFLTARVLRRVRLLSLRDAGSFAWAQQHVASAKQHEVYQSCDPVLSASLLPHEPPPLPASLAAAGGYLLVLPRATGDLPTPRESTTEAQALVQLLHHAQAVTGLQPLVFPMQLGRDQAICREVVEAGAGAVWPLAFPDSEAYYNSALWATLRGASLVISYRLHGLVCAAAHGIPALGVAYDPKVQAFCEAIGYPWCFPATVHHTASMAELENLWQYRQEVAVNAAERRSLMLDQLAAVEQRFHELW